MFTIRAFDYSQGDYETLVAIDRIAAPQFPMSVADWQESDRNVGAGEFLHRDFILKNGTPVGYADCRQFANFIPARKFFFDVVVLPEADDPAIRPLYLQHVLALLQGRDPAVLVSGTLDDHALAVAFLNEAGFVEVQRDQFSELDLAGFDPAPFAPTAARVAESGIAILTLPEWQARDPQWKTKLYELDWLVMQDVPAATAPLKPTLEEFERKRLSGPNFYADGWFVALDGDQPVAESYVLANASAPETLYTGTTGVRREYRRRGIATALKLRVIEHARARGFTTLSTSNAATNPMLQLNYALGFVDRPAWVVFEKRLAPQPA